MKMKTATISPMLALNADLSKVCFPVFASHKIDGIRAVVRDGIVYSRSGKPILNAFVQDMFGHLHGFDGELVVGQRNSPDVFRKTQAVMSEYGEPEASFIIFDSWNRTNTYAEWLAEHIERMNAFCGNGVFLLRQHLVGSLPELTAFEEKSLAEGYEGIMLRGPHSGYKFGRSTLKEGFLLKVKRFAEAEAEIIGKEEQHSENGTPKATLGAFTVRNLSDGVIFNLGAGFTKKERDSFWHGAIPDNAVVRYRYFPTGNKNAPRFPVFAGLRNRIDTEICCQR
ncbi:MAG: hypothetical protein LBR94_00870 [Desulfovibrio sp.]|jgi:DNA ligase-1|nr:hypothetical protein [Desulfovibrio sp.]